jgi:hypothetical protein
MLGILELDKWPVLDQVVPSDSDQGCVQSDTAIWSHETNIGFHSSIFAQEFNCGEWRFGV